AVWLPARRRLYRSHHQGREAGRPASADAHQVRPSDQPQNREGAWARPAGVRARPRRRGDRMTRREFITLLGGAAAWPLAERAQQPAGMRQIGVLMGWRESDPEARLERGAFVQELQKLGWLDGRNLRIDTRGANPADPESMHRYAKELVALQPD